MKRPIIWCCLAFCAGIYCYAYTAEQCLLCGILFALICLGLALRKRSVAFFALLFFFAFGMASLALHQEIVLDRPTAMHQTEHDFKGTVSNVSENRDGRYSYQISLSSLDGKRSFLKLWISSEQGWNAGDEISGTGLLQASKTMKLQEEGFGDYLVRNGYSFYCQNPELSAVPLSRRNRILSAPMRLRIKITDLLNKHLHMPWKGVLIAVSTGDRSFVSEQQKKIFSQTGTSHILSVSGLHISILLMLIMALFRMFRIPDSVVRWICLPIPLLLALFMGGQTPVLRTCIMGFLFLLGDCLWTESDSFNSLFLAAFLILLTNPVQLFQSSFLLSFSSTLGILMFSEILRHTAEKRFPAGPLLNMISVTVSSYLTSLMVLLSFYHQLPVTALIANILVIPFFPVLLAGIFLFAAIAALIPAAAPIVAKIPEGMAELLFGPLSWLAKVPTIEYSVPNRFFIAAYCCFLVFCYFLCRKQKKPLLLCCCIFCIISGGFYEYRLSKFDSFTVVHAGCIRNALIQTTEGHTVLYAGISGNASSYSYDYQEFLRYFQKNNIKTIDVFCFMNYNKSTVAFFRDLGQDTVIKQSLLLPNRDLAPEIDRISRKNHVKITDLTQSFDIILSENNRCTFSPDGTLLWYYQDTLTAKIGKDRNGEAPLICRIGAGEVIVDGRMDSQPQQKTLRFLIQQGTVQQCLPDTTYEQGELP